MHTDQTLPDLNGNVLWLIPSQPEFSTYVSEIKRLSETFDSTPFTPHLTLARLPDDVPTDELVHSLSSILKHQEFDFGATHLGLGCHDSPYQNCIQNLSPTPDLERFLSILQQALPLVEPKQEYHISLKYGYTSCRDLDQVKERLTNHLPVSVSFDKIRLVELAGGPGDWKNTWQENV